MEEAHRLLEEYKKEMMDLKLKNKDLRKEVARTALDTSSAAKKLGSQRALLEDMENESLKEGKNFFADFDGPLINDKFTFGKQFKEKIAATDGRKRPTSRAGSQLEDLERLDEDRPGLEYYNWNDAYKLGSNSKRKSSKGRDSSSSQKPRPETSHQSKQSEVVTRSGQKGADNLSRVLSSGGGVSKKIFGGSNTQVLEEEISELDAEILELTSKLYDEFNSMC
jgi:hypothetical protein